MKSLPKVMHCTVRYEESTGLWKAETLEFTVESAGASFNDAADNLVLAIEKHINELQMMRRPKKYAARRFNWHLCNLLALLGVPMAHGQFRARRCVD